MTPTHADHLVSDADYAEYLAAWEADIESSPEFVADIPEARTAVPSPTLLRPVFLSDDWDVGTPPAVPTMVPVEGGEPLLYPGESHYVYGRGGSGKSWFCYRAAWDVARAGGVTLLMDYESNRRTVKTRMKAMGVEKGDAGRVAYWKVGGSLAPRTETASAFRDWVLEHRPQLVVLDSVSRAMSYMGLDENSNSDYATFDRVFAQPLVALGVTVLMIDHIGHDSPDRRGTPKPRGASNKTDHISGAMFFFRATAAWSRHRSGGGELVCVKDREGERAEGDVVADVVVTVAEGASPSVVFELVAPNVDAARREAEVVELPEWDMEKVSRFLEDFPEASFTVSTLRQSKKDGGAGVSGRNYQAVLEHLLAAGRVRKVGGRWQHVAPFRVGDTL